MFIVVTLLVIVGLVGFLTQRDMERRKKERPPKKSEEEESAYYDGPQEEPQAGEVLKEDSSPYEKADSLLTPTESKFHYVLGLVIQDKYVIQLKVGIKDVVKVKSKDDMSSFNRIAKKHLDFVICSRRHLKPLCAIELDDYTHKWRSSKKRDAVKDEVMRSAGVPLYRFKVRPYYEQEMIRERLRESLGDL